MDYLKLEGKSAIVTGGASGIGRAISHYLSDYGVMVMICDIDIENGERVKKEIKQKNKIVEFCKCDVSEYDEIKNAIQITTEKFGKIDILVNNAGVGGKLRPFWTISNSDWDRMQRVDLTSAFMFCREVFLLMRGNNYGKIINISSGAGVTGMPGNLHYTAAKSGMIGMTKAMAKEVAQYKINVNAIAVGTTLTPMAKADGFNDFVPDDIPWGRLGTPEDVANVVLFLASDASEYITGQVIAPNGGRRT